MNDPNVMPHIICSASAGHHFEFSYLHSSTCKGNPHLTHQLTNPTDILMTDVSTPIRLTDFFTTWPTFLQLGRLFYNSADFLQFGRPTFTFHLTNRLRHFPFLSGHVFILFPLYDIYLLFHISHHPIIYLYLYIPLSSTGSSFFPLWIPC
jgi:hypothetical protein